MQQKNLSTPKTIALVGNPNCGKSTLFNALTGSKQKIANYSGVTVEKKEGFLQTQEGQTLRVFDLPGLYSLSATRTLDEKITAQILTREFQGEESSLDGIIYVADATHLDLNLTLLLELKSLHIPTIVALNMMDLAQSRGIEHDVAILEEEFGCSFIPLVATKKQGLDNLIQAAENLVAQKHPPRKQEKITADSGDILRQKRKEVMAILARAEKKQEWREHFSEKLDSVLLHPVYGIFILLLTLFALFQAVFTWAEIPKGFLENSFAALQSYILELLPQGLLRSLLVDGIIAGVGSIIVFLPQIIILLFFVYLLESTGYMARAAFLLDRVMGGVGLHGKAFIPLLSSFACAIPGIMATRTIENRRERLITILIAPLMSCSARIPVYALIIAAFIPQRKVLGVLDLQGLVMFSLYLAGILAAFIIAFLLKIIGRKGPQEPLLVQLPSYKLPSLRNIILHLLERSKAFLIQAGTILLAMIIVIWFLSIYPYPPAGATESPIHYTFAGMIGRWLEPFFAPLGFNWQIVVALIPGMAAREVAVGALATVYSLSGSEEAVQQSLMTTLASSWSLPTALSLLAWYVFAPQCISTLAVVKRETHSWLWPVVLFVYMVALAYSAAFVTFTIASYF